MSIELDLTLTSPLHHGAGSSGNTSILRTQEIMLPGGGTARVPYVSANSVRNGLRTAIAWDTVRSLGVEDTSLSKGTVDLLWSGGAVTHTGSEVDLDLWRRIEEVYPALNLFGFAAGSDIFQGTLMVSDLMLVCQENLWRLPERFDSEDVMRAAAYRGEAFGTRHDIDSSPVARFIQAADQVTGTTQMIYDIQTLKPGARLYGEIMLRPSATAAHELVLSRALQLWAPGWVVRLGAKNAVGFGTATVNVSPDLVDGTGAEIMGERDQVIGLLREITS